MADFDVAQTLRESRLRSSQVASGQRLIPVLAAIMAAFAALSTLFARHNSIVALSQKNEALLYETKATDQYNYFEAARIRTQLDRSFIDAGVVAGNRERMRALEQRIKTGTTQANSVFEKAQALEGRSDEDIDRSERFMGKYENYEIAAMFFEISIVLVSIAAMARTKVMLYIAGALSLAGVGFLIAGALR